MIYQPQHKCSISQTHPLDGKNGFQIEYVATLNWGDHATGFKIPGLVPHILYADELRNTIYYILRLIDSGSALGGVPRAQKMLKGHLPRVIHHEVY